MEARLASMEWLFVTLMGLVVLLTVYVALVVLYKMLKGDKR